MSAAMFGLVVHRSTLEDFASLKDSERVKAINYPEVEATLRAP